MGLSDLRVPLNGGGAPGSCFTKSLYREDKDGARAQRQNANQVHRNREEPKLRHFIFPHTHYHGWHTVNRHIATVPAGYRDRNSRRRWVQP